MVSSDCIVQHHHRVVLMQSVISIEASKADLKILDVFKSHGYSNEIGPGVYDIHSPVSALDFRRRPLTYRSVSRPSRRSRTVSLTWPRFSRPIS